MRFKIPIVCTVAFLWLAGCPQRATHENLHSILWNQTSGEYDATVAQAFRTAGERLREALGDPTWTAALEQDPAGIGDLPAAVIVDVDETILDNSPYQAFLAVEHAEFTKKTWEQWVEKRSAAALPGAKPFLNEAAAQGVTVFYVTNRSSELEEATRANLEQAGFPIDTTRDTVLTKGENDWGSDKTERRAEVAKSHRILLLLGDDMNDFVSGARAEDPETRRELARRHLDKWGKQWILLPNQMYGSWEASLYGRNNELPEFEKLRRKLGHLSAFRPGSAD